MTYWCLLILPWFKDILVLIPLRVSVRLWMKRDISDSGSVCIVCHCKSHDTMGNIMHNNNSLWLCVTLADGDAVERVCAYLCVCVCVRVRLCVYTSVWRAGGEWNHKAVYQTHRKWVLLSEDVSRHHILLLESSFRWDSVHTMYSKQQMQTKCRLCMYMRAVCDHLILPQKQFLHWLHSYDNLLIWLYKSVRRMHFGWRVQRCKKIK